MLLIKPNKIEPDYYEDPYLHDPRLLDLVSRIKCLPLDEADKPELANLCELEVVSLQESDARRRNGREVRLMAQKHLRADRVDNLLRILWGIENEPQVALS